MGGTILFAILAIVHAASGWRLVELLYYSESLDFLEFSAELAQFLSLVVYVGMIFVPIKMRLLRWILAAFFTFSLIDNLTAFGILYRELSLIDSISLCLVAVDLLAITALLMKPTSKFSRVMPFYAVEEEPHASP